MARAASRYRPQAVAFDVIGTLFPLEPLRPRIMALGLAPEALEGWFAAGLRDAFALALTHGFKPFATVLDAALDTLLAERRLDPPAAARQAVLAALEELDPRHDAAAALRLLADAGVTTVALTNGSRHATLALLKRAGFPDRIDHVVSVAEVKRSKPALDVYRHAAVVAGVEPAALALVAAHPWDVQGAHAAGLTTAYLAADRPFAAVMDRPDVEAATLDGCVAALLALPPAPAPAS